MFILIGEVILDEPRDSLVVDRGQGRIDGYIFGVAAFASDFEDMPWKSGETPS